MPAASPIPPSLPTAWGAEPRRPGLAGALQESGVTLLTALRLLLRHWPALLAIFLAGVVARELLLRAAVRTSLLSSELGALVLMLVPLATLAALVLMLRVVRPSLPWLGGPGAGAPRSVLDHLGSVLVPFMTIYYFEDYLIEDALAYSARILEDTIDRETVAILDGGEAAVGVVDRLPYQLSVGLVAVVGAAYAGRWLLNRDWASGRHPWLGVPGAYLELVWVMLAYFVFLGIAERIVVWGEGRQLVNLLATGWTEGVGSLAGVSAPVHNATGWFTEQVAAVDGVLVVPIAWLAVGAIVLGSQAPAGGSGMPAGRGRVLYERARQGWAAAPPLLRGLVRRATDSDRGKFTALAQGFRMLLRGGVAPMLLFCLAFVAARTLADWVWELQRLLIGPQPVDEVWVPLAWPLYQLNRAASYAVMICLLAAAVDRAVRNRPAPAPQSPVPQATGSQA